MLAHTATIEAARAGEHGRGFVAVATEMQNLSKLATKAAEEIKNNNWQIGRKVSDSRILVAQGKQHPGRTRQFHNIVFTIKMSEILAFSEQQTYWHPRKVNLIIGQMDDVTQRRGFLCTSENIIG